MNFSFSRFSLLAFRLPLLLTLLVLAPLLADGTKQRSASALPQKSRLILTITDEKDQPLVGARCSLLTADERETVAEAMSDEQGHASFTDLAPGSYTLRIIREGFAPLTRKNVAIESEKELSLAISLSVAPLAANVTVSAGGTLPTDVEAGATIPKALLKREEIRILPLPAQKLTAALPLTPGVIRSPKGELSIKGLQESQGALIINGVHANLADPRFGIFFASSSRTFAGGFDLLF